MVAPKGVVILLCRVCVSQDLPCLFQTWRDGRCYSVLFCKRCETIQTAEPYEKVSPDYVNLRLEEIGDQRIWCQGSHKERAFRQWWGQVHRLMRDGKVRGGVRLLDIGCGTGGFLRYAEEMGFEVYGFDASEAQAEFAREHLGRVRQAETVESYIEMLAGPEVKFDIITLWDVLEHLRKPVEFLREVRSVLQPGGLVFISTPNAAAMMWKMRLYKMFGKWRAEDWIPWEHVFYFSVRSLGLCLQEAGYEIVARGAVVCYRRELSTFECLRRSGFAILKVVPWQSPQIYAWGRLADGTAEGTRDLKG